MDEKQTREVVEDNPHTIESMDGRYTAEVESSSVVKPSEEQP